MTVEHRNDKFGQNEFARFWPRRLLAQHGPNNSASVHADANAKQDIRIPLLVRSLDGQNMVISTDGVIKRPLIDRFEFDVQTFTLNGLAIVFPDWRVAVECVRPIGFGFHGLDLVDRNGGQNCFEDLIARGHAGHQVQTDQFGARATFTAGRVVSVSDQDRAVVACGGDNGRDLRVDQLGTQHQRSSFLVLRENSGTVLKWSSRYNAVHCDKIVSHCDRDTVLEHRLTLGKYLGINLYVHWTFSLIVGLVVYGVWDEGPQGIAYGLGVLLGVYLCVTLHEYGHSMAARCFGIRTVDITLLPIGGVARLERMPRIPWHELVVAVAGPAVNVVIASVLLVSLYAGGYLDPLLDSPFSTDALNAWFTSHPEPSFLSYATFMLGVNIMLVVFNAVPAFPMDGGRVLRSLLAMVTEYKTATFIASRVGLVIAALMLYYAVSTNHIQLGLVALFVAYAGTMEARQVDVTEAVRGISIADAMIRDPESVMMDAGLQDLSRRWQTLSAKSLPVLSGTGSVVGMLRLSDLAAALERDPLTQLTAGQIADHEVERIRLHESLDAAILGLGKDHRRFPVVDNEGQLLGIVDLDTAVHRGKITRNVPPHLPVNQPGFDVTT